MRIDTITILLVLGVAAASLAEAQLQQDPVCHTYISKGLIQPGTGSLRDVIIVTDSFVAGDVTVSLDVSHPRVGALEIMLTAQPLSAPSPTDGAGRTIILKSRGLGRRGANLYGTTFSDHATVPFPLAPVAAPFSGTYLPTQRLGFLLDGSATSAGGGGSQGAWLLTINDLAPNATRRLIALNGWTLVLCERTASLQAQPPAAPPAPLVAAMDGPPDSALDSVFSQVQRAAAADGPPAAQPAPAPAAAVAAASALDRATAPAPAVKAASGPADTQQQQQQQQQQMLFGWRIITRSASPGAAAAAVAAATDAPSQQPLLAAAAVPSAAPSAAVVFPWTAAASLRRQVDSALAQYFGALCGNPGCAAEKRAMWRAAILAMYIRAAAETHEAIKEDAAAWLGQLQQWLPGDQPVLAAMQQWLMSHQDELDKLGGWLRQNNLLPQLQLPTLGHWQLPSLSQLFTANPVLDRLAQGLQAEGQLLQDMQGDNVKQAAQEVAAAFAGLFSKA